jgi:hypothetical protein
MPKKITSMIAVIVVLSVGCMSAYSAEENVAFPKVIDTNPKNGSRDVDPTLKEISVTFSEPMTDRSWSWSYEDKNQFPQMTGQPFYSDNFTKCVLPVKLETKKEYVIWINTSKFHNFRNKAGVPVPPYKLRFTTR